MARVALGDQSDVDSDLPVGEVASPSVVPVPPSPTLPDETPPANQPATRPVGSSFSDLSATFNGMSRQPTEAPPQASVDQGGQIASSIANQTNDLTMMQSNLLAEVNAGQFSGAALGHVQAILFDLTSAISAANATASLATPLGGGANAQQALRASQLSIINAVSTDPALVAPTPEPPPPTDADSAPHNLAEIGALFDNVASQILGGVDDDNRARIADDINAVISDIQALMAADPKMFEGLTGEHADTIVQQLQLELAYINDPTISPTAAQAANDNILDIIEIIQSDPNLADLAKQIGVNGASPLPDATPIHLDSAGETAFVANFIAQSNSLGQQAVDLVASNDARAIAALIDDLKAFEKSVTDLGADQGGVLGAEIAAMIKGLQTGDAHLVTAAAGQMHGNAADLAAGNAPVTGGTYHTDGLTLAEVLGTPLAETAPAASSPISVDTVTMASVDLTALAVDGHSPASELAHLHHMWG
jgi:hypothetical protein